jgi:cytidine deaminase
MGLLAQSEISASDFKHYSRRVSVSALHFSNADLLSAAQHAAAHAYAPYSRFVVGAAAITENGQIFAGANMENSSYGMTICAEVGALQSALLGGQLEKIRRIAIVGGSLERASSHRPMHVFPCGRCRQLILEASNLAKFDIEIISADLDLKVNGGPVSRRISELLPDGFGPANFDDNGWDSARIQSSLLSRIQHRADDTSS